MPSSLRSRSCPPPAAESLPLTVRVLCRVRHRVLRTMGAALFGLGLWTVAALVVEALRGIPFPTPWDCLLELCRLLGGATFLEFTLYEHVGASCLRWLAGFLLACALAVTYAGLALASPLFRSVSLPTVEVLQLIPGLAWVPVAILLFGLGQTATVSIIVLTTFPVLALSVLMGFSCTDRDLVRVGRMCGCTGSDLFRTVYLPSALSHLLSGLRLGVGASWRVLIAAEMVTGSGEGLGFAIIQSRWTMDYVAAFACIAVIAVIGLCLERCLFLPLERHTLRRWRGEA